MQSFLYPIALDVRQRRCVVVGGGAVGERRAKGLLESGASVCVVSPDITASLAALLEQSHAEYRRETFRPEHLDGAMLVVAATDDDAANTAVAEAARSRGVLLNQAAPGEAGESGDFVTMAAVRRGELVVGVTTGGAGPAVTARLRRELDSEFGPEWEEYIALLRDIRELAKNKIISSRQRQAVLRRLAEMDSVRERIADGDTQGAREEAMKCLSYLS